MKAKKVMSLALAAAMIAGMTASTTVNCYAEDESVDKIIIFQSKVEIIDQLEELAETYEDETGIEVEVWGTTGDDCFQQLKTKLANGQGPTVYSLLPGAESETMKNYEADLSDLSFVDKIAEEVYKDQELTKEAGDLSKEIREAVEKYAIVAGEAKDFYAYEVDGFGQYNVMDDANLPSLLSMPYIGYCDKENERYQNTRGMVLSERNSYYFPGKVLTGIGSQHTDTRYVWSMSLCMQGITSDNKEEKEAIFKMLENSDGGTNLMYESIFADDDTKYTRPWFSWANSVFCEFVMDYLGYSVKLY